MGVRCGGCKPRFATVLLVFGGTGLSRRYGERLRTTEGEMLRSTEGEEASVAEGVVLRSPKERSFGHRRSCASVAEGDVSSVPEGVGAPVPGGVEASVPDDDFGRGGGSEARFPDRANYGNLNDSSICG